MDLRSIAAALNGDVVGGQVLAPGPGHGPRDRSLAVRPGFRGQRDTFICHSFAGDDWKECRDFIRQKLGLPDDAPRRKAAEPAPAIRVSTDDAKIKKARARHIWTCRQPIEGTPAERYLRESRGYRGPLPPTLGYLPSRAGGPPSMIAAFALADEQEPGTLAIADRAVQGIHLTRLKPDGSGKAAIEPAKIMMGPSSGFPIVLSPPNDLLGLAVTEGIEDGLAALSSGLGVWVAGSASRMPALAATVPDFIECVTIAADSDEAGRKNAETLAERLVARGVAVVMAKARV